MPIVSTHRFSVLLESLRSHSRNTFYLSHWRYLMRCFVQSVVSFLKKEDGPTAVEYAVMLALIIVVCIAAITTLGSNANQTFSFVGSAIQP
jgi:pilus assembly protein Flp/PilA